MSVREAKLLMKNRRKNGKRMTVRAPLPVEVEFQVMDANEYAAIKEKGIDRPQCLLGPSVILEPPGNEEANHSCSSSFDLFLVDYLICIEEKLDRILKLVSKNQGSNGYPFIGEGLNIGGGGMKILSPQPVEPGQVLKISFRMLRYPLMSLKVFGEVVRVIPFSENGIDRYEVAVEFLDLNEEFKERIIAYVFQMQREAIRNSKKRSCNV